VAPPKKGGEEEGTEKKGGKEEQKEKNRAYLPVLFSGLGLCIVVIIGQWRENALRALNPWVLHDNCSRCSLVRVEN